MAEATTIARPYARAAFEAAAGDKASGLKHWSDMLAVAASAAADSDMRKVLANPEYDSQLKAGLFLELCGDRLDAGGSNFIKLLAENQRLNLLPEIAAVFEELRAEAEKTVEAEVISAFEVSNEQQQKILTNVFRKRRCHRMDVYGISTFSL